MLLGGPKDEHFSYFHSSCQLGLMHSNSLGRHFSSMFHAECLLPGLDELLLVRSWLKYFYQCKYFFIDQDIIWENLFFLALMQIWNKLFIAMLFKMAMKKFGASFGNKQKLPMLHQKKIYFSLVWLAVKKKDFWTGT